MLTAIGVVREKEFGSIANFYSSPMTRLEFLWGKQIPYIVITAITFIILLGVIRFLFNVPFKGSFPALVTGAMLYIIITTGLGLLISTFTQTQIASLLAAFVITTGALLRFIRAYNPCLNAYRRGQVHVIGLSCPLFPEHQRGHLHQGNRFPGASVELCLPGHDLYDHSDHDGLLAEKTGEIV